MLDFARKPERERFAVFEEAGKRIRLLVRRGATKGAH